MLDFFVHGNSERPMGVSLPDYHFCCSPYYACVSQSWEYMDKFKRQRPNASRSLSRHWLPFSFISLLDYNVGTICMAHNRYLHTSKASEDEANMTTETATTTNSNIEKRGNERKQIEYFIRLPNATHVPRRRRGRQQYSAIETLTRAGKRAGSNSTATTKSAEQHSEQQAIESFCLPFLFANLR